MPTCVSIPVYCCTPILALCCLLAIGFTATNAQGILTGQQMKEWETGTYKPGATEGETWAQLEMAYASAVIRNPQTWLEVPKSRKIHRIDLVFTKYPVLREKWITPYDSLLRWRLAAIQQLLPEAFSPDVAWRLVLQTDGRTAKDAQHMFHGVYIYYSTPEEPGILVTTTDTTMAPPMPAVAVSPKPVKPSPPQVPDYRFMDFRDVRRLLDGDIPFRDTLIFEILHRNLHWKDILLVNDWTASMYIYGTQALYWHKHHLKEKNIGYFVFFNDGNRKPNRLKKPGQTGGVYGIDAEDIESIARLMQKVIARGDGGDRQENDVEAILYGLKKYKKQRHVVLLADNKSELRDAILIGQINRPVHIIPCGVVYGVAVHNDYLKMAWATKGSLHTRHQDIYLKDFTESDQFELEGVWYAIKNNQLVVMPQAP